MVGRVNWQTICHDRSVVPNIQQTISNFTNNEFQDIIEAWIFSLNPNSLTFDNYTNIHQSSNFGLNGFLNFIPMPPPPENMMKFAMALMETGFFIATFYII